MNLVGEWGGQKLQIYYSRGKNHSPESYFYHIGPVYLYAEYMKQEIAQVAAGTLSSLWKRNQRMLIRTEAVMSLEAGMVPQHRGEK